MKKILLGSISIMLAGMTYAAPHSWQGPYIGMMTGGTWGTAHALIASHPDGYLTVADAALVNAAGNQTIRANGFLAGVEGGYNWIIKQHYFAGVEADIETLKLGDSSRSDLTKLDSSSSSFISGAYVNINWLATLRPRIGFMWNDALIYGTAGLAVTQLYGNFFYSDDTAMTSAVLNTRKTGYAVGGGTEFALTEKWSMKVEYLYAGFGRTDATDTGSTIKDIFPEQTFAYSTNLNVNMLRVGVNYEL